jgi:hypothetical protein
MPATLEIQNIRNLTSGLELVPTRDCPSVTVVGCTSQSLIFQMHLCKIVLGHVLNLRGQIDLNGEKTQFRATGKVAAVVEDADGKQVRFEAQLIQYEKSLWRQFLKSLLESQDRADRLLAAIKGED